MADEEDSDDELGQVAEQVNGIANRFQRDAAGTTDTTDTTDTSNTSGMTETSETSDTKNRGRSDGETTGTTNTTATSETIETTESIETTETPAPGDPDFQLREHWNGRTIYLPDEVVDDLDIRYQECSLAWRREHGEELPKNERFYPAVIQAALNETSIETELGLDEIG